MGTRGAPTERRELSAEGAIGFSIEAPTSGELAVPGVSLGSTASRRAAGRRAVSTSQPDVTCAICQRRLLRGEQPDSFVADNRTHTVCELCVARARDFGWVRASDAGQQGHPAAARRRRGSGLIGMLRRARAGSAAAGESPAAPSDRANALAVAGPGAAGANGHGIPLDTADRLLTPAPGADPLLAPDRVLAAKELPAGSAAAAVPAATGADPLCERAVESFNQTQGPRRIAGVARSLGPPWVTVRPAASAAHGYGHPPAAARVAIIAAWELSWYRWELDLEEPAGVELVARGTELDELPPEDLAPNAQADERGRLTLGPLDSAGPTR